MFNRKKYEQDAVNLYRSTNAAILSTMSKKYEGYPFGSFITYATDKSRTLFIFFSNQLVSTSDILIFFLNISDDIPQLDNSFLVKRFW